MIFYLTLRDNFDILLNMGNEFIISFQIKSWALIDGEKHFVWSSHLQHDVLRFRLDCGKMIPANDHEIEFLD